MGADDFFVSGSKVKELSKPESGRGNSCAMSVDLVTLLPGVWLACSFLFCCCDKEPGKKRLKEWELTVARGVRLQPVRAQAA